MEEKKFKFIYRAPTKSEREEIEDIRKNYLPVQERDLKLKEMKELDSRVNGIPVIVTFILAFFGILIFGIGLSCVLQWNYYILGSLIAVIGCLPLGFTHFVYVKLKATLTEKYKDRILQLSEELLNEDSSENEQKN